MTRIASGVTDQYIYFVAVDSTDLKTRETGLSSFTVYRSRNGGVAAAFTTPTINETDTTNMPGVYELLLDEDMTIDAGDDTQEMVLHITHAGMAPVTRTFELYRPKITAGETLTTSSGVASADAVQISGDSTAADNLEATFDGTGYTDDYAPATQIQVGGIASSFSGESTHPESYVLTTGTLSSGTVDNTHALDGVYHTHTDDAGAMDLYYQFDIGDNLPVSATITGYLQGGNDSLEVYAYNWVDTAWERIGTRAGSGAATNQAKTYLLFPDMVGTGGNVGKVRIRFTDGAFTLTSAVFAVDQIVVSSMHPELTGSEVAAAVLDEADAIETGWTLRKVMRIISAVLAGKVSGGGTGTEVFRDITDTKDRVTSTNDASGNRTSVTLDGS